MTNPNIAIDITANDKSGKGIASAEKRLGKLGGDAKKIGDKGGFGNLIRTFGEVDKAASGAFGSKSVFATIGSRGGAFLKIGSALNGGLGRTAANLGKVEAVGSGAATTLGETAVAAGAAEAGMGEAAVAAGGLAAAMGPVAVIGIGAVAVLGAAAVAGYKFASGWAAGTTQLGRFADTMGISTKALQEFQGAAERLGIDKDAAGGALGGLSQTLNDARYGRNNSALAVLMRLGVKMRTNADGTVDVNAMLPDIANAIARQNSSGRRTAAGALGIPVSALPAFSQGGAALSKDMSDIDRHGVMNTGKDIATAQQFTRDAATLGQMADRAKQRAQADTAGKYSPVMEKGIALGRDALDGTLGAKVAQTIGAGAAALQRSITNDFVPAAAKIAEAATKMLQDAAARARMGVGSSDLADRIEHLGERSRQNQISPVGARGVMQIMPDTARGIARRNGIAFDEDRYKHDADYNRMLGRLEVSRLAEKYGNDPVLVAAAYNAGDAVLDPGGYRDKHGRHQESWIKRFGDPRKGEISDEDFARKIPFAETRAYAERVAGIPVHVTVEFAGTAPRGARATATAGASKTPAISHALAS